jgi:hypothetical protein
MCLPDGLIGGGGGTGFGGGGCGSGSGVVTWVTNTMLPFVSPATTVVKLSFNYPAGISLYCFFPTFAGTPGKHSYR